MVKKKFKGLRDSYRKLKVEQCKRSGAGAYAPPTWPWWPYMHWLEPHLAIYDKE